MSQVAEKINIAPPQCECGRHYPSPEAAQLCRDNNHHVGKDRFADTIRFRPQIETTFTIQCMGCTADLRGRVVQMAGGFHVDVYPHVCSVRPEGVNVHG